MPDSPPQGSPGAYTSRQLGSVFGSSLLGFGMDGYNNLVLAIVLPSIAASLHLHPLALASVVSGQLLASMLGGVVFGWLGDVLGRKRTLMLTIVVYSLGAVMSALSNSYGTLMIARLITGLGVGGEWGAGMVLFAEAWSPQRRGLGASLIQSSVLAGQAAVGLVAGWAFTAYGVNGWHIVMLTGALPVILAVYVRFGLPESHLWEEYQHLARNRQLPSDKLRQGTGLLALFRSWKNVWLVARGTLLVGGFFVSIFSFTLFLPTLVITGYHTSPAVFGSLNAVVSWISILYYLLVGWLSDRWGRRRAFVTPACIMLVGIGLFYLVTRAGSHYPGSLWAWPLFWTYLVIQVGSAASGLFGPWLSEIFPVETRNTASSLCYNVGKGASALTPLVISLFGVAGLGRGIAIVGALGCAVMLLFGLMLPETRGRVFTAIDYGIDAASAAGDS